MAETRIETRGVEAGVEHLQHFGGRTRMLHDMFAKDSDRE